MNTFNYYSEYYDLLYIDKDYQGEVDYIDKLIKKYTPQPKSMIDFGCGTGSHDLLFLEKGYDLVGVDLSHEMIERAKLKKLKENKTNISFLQGDIRNVNLEKEFDVAVSLFHVMSYQTSNEDLLNAFETIRRHLKKGGVFVFDFWYGPGVLTDPPTVRIKRLENDNIKVTRLSEPIAYPNENKIEVYFEVQIENKKNKNQIETFKEIHSMRYIFLPELELIAKQIGFEFLEVREWMKDKAPNIDTWNTVVICKKL